MTWGRSEGSRRRLHYADRDPLTPTGSPRAIARVVDASPSGRSSKRWLPQVVSPRASDRRHLCVCVCARVRPAEAIGASVGPQPIALDGVGATAERPIANIAGQVQPE